MLMCDCVVSLCMPFRAQGRGRYASAVRRAHDLGHYITALVRADETGVIWATSEQELGKSSSSNASSNIYVQDNMI